MWAASVIVFREILEMSFIIGMMLAATKTLPNNKRYVFGGIALGVIFSCLFALMLTSTINFVKPEIFNSAILGIAVLMVIYTIFWMKEHFTDYKAKITKAVAGNSLPTISLILIVASAVTREGAEIIIFLYSMAQTAALDYFSIFLGLAIGVLGGSFVGALFYLSILKISPKYFFRITSVLLALFAANMSTEIATLLIESGNLPNLTNPLWDSSWLIDSKSLLGQIAKSLLGYNPTPLPLQTIFYIGTLGAIGTMLVVSRAEAEK
jgi:high-affinity iron transporter